MKGTITLQPLREEKKEIVGWPVFETEQAIFGNIDHKDGDKIYLQEGKEDGHCIPEDTTKEFMVLLEDGSMVELHHDNIDEAMGNNWWDYYSDCFGESVEGKELNFKVEIGVHIGVASVIIAPVEVGTTERGFSKGEFTDQYGAKCSIQASSIATKECIWLGVNDADPQIMASQAAEHGVETTETTGWVKYPIPSEVSLSTRMHLSREDVKKMLPLLTKFVETGSLT